MRILRPLLTGLMILVGAAMLAGPARADAYNKETKLTFNQPVEVPGMVLPAGTYTFRLLDTMGSRNIVQIFNADETKLITTIITIYDYRLTPADQTVIQFNEQQPGTPAALRTWFYPGDNYGREFVYPKKRAVQLAQQAQAPVPAETAEVPASQLKSVPLVAVTPEAKEEPLEQAFETTPPANQAPLVAQQTPAPKTLPKTAGSTPLIASVGFVSIMLGFGVKSIFAKNRA
jgi:hypothetical protein